MWLEQPPAFPAKTEPAPIPPKWDFNEPKAAARRLHRQRLCRLGRTGAHRMDRPRHCGRRGIRSEHALLPCLLARQGLPDLLLRAGDAPEQCATASPGRRRRTAFGCSRLGRKPRCGCASRRRSASVPPLEGRTKPPRSPFAPSTASGGPPPRFAGEEPGVPASTKCADEHGHFASAIYYDRRGGPSGREFCVSTWLGPTLFALFRSRSRRP